MKQSSFKVHAAGIRADIFVAQAFPEYSRSSLTGLFDKGKVTINGKQAKAGQKLKPGDEIQVDATNLFKQPEKIDLPVLYEDDSVIVINKPADVLTHSKGAINSEPTVASFIKDKVVDKNLAGNRAGIVHRLDRATSGVIICAKTKLALDWLQKQFSQRKTTKTYEAIVEGTPKEIEAVIDAPIGRNPKHPQTFKIMTSGKPAQTGYEVVKSFNKAGKKYSRLLLTPTTGRTHQLRVHLAYINNPIVGDRIYGKEDKHMLLHAKSLRVSLPSGKQETFTAPTPGYFKDFEAAK